MSRTHPFCAIVALLLAAPTGTALAQVAPNGVGSQPPPPMCPAPEGEQRQGESPIGPFGATQEYARKGNVELGGSAGFTSGNDSTRINVSPSFGYFFVDSWQLSAIVDLAYLTVGGVDSKSIAGIAEISYHLPLGRSRMIFGEAGFGVGPIHQSGMGTGVALAPEVGVNLILGENGILTPAVGYRYTTIDGMHNALTFNMGYTVAW
ncbi:MAG TPA: hypothetical protein VM734_01170 [Kofleriaceae bacterium]|nr:hypothetical protein [Kofleriaceae bacterium]